MDPGYLAAFGGAVCYGVGSVLQSQGARRVAGAAGGEVDARLLVRVASQLPYLVGLGLDLGGFLLSLVAVRRLPLFAVEAILAASVGVTALLAVPVLRVRPTRTQLGWLVVLAGGLVLLAGAAGPQRPGNGGSALEVGMWAGVPVLAAATWWAFRLTGDRAASVLGAVSGLSFGGTAICARAAHGTLWTDPLVWALLAYGGLGLTQFAAALARGSVTVASACQFATETVLPAAVGLAVLGDAARRGWGLGAVVGFLLTAGSAVVLAWVSPEQDAPTRAADRAAAPPATGPPAATAPPADEPTGRQEAAR